MGLGEIGKPIPMHFTAEKNRLELCGKVCAANGEELVPDQLCGAFASVKSPFTIFVTSLLRKR